MFITTLVTALVIGKHWKPPKSAANRTNKLLMIFLFTQWNTKEGEKAKQVNKLLLQAMSWISLENLMLKFSC